MIGRRRRRGMIGRAIVAIGIAMWWPLAAAAHPAPFSYLDVRVQAEGLDGSLIIHDWDAAHDVGVDPPERLRDAAVAAAYRDQLTRLMDSRLAIIVDGQRQPLTWTGFESLPERQSLRLTFRTGGRGGAGRVRVEGVLFPYDPIHQTFVNVYDEGTLRHQAILDARRTGADYYPGTWQGVGAVLAVFVPAGIEHILIGPDHVLFLIGLLLLGGTVWRLTTIVTAFTLGHSVTLSLAALDVLSPPASLIEPVIALSIVFVGADNLLVQREETRRLAAAGSAADRAPQRDIRPWVAGVFGLVHGFGFASVLKQFGLPVTALGWSLFSFNAGVEIGQLAIVLAAAAALHAVRRRHPATAIGLVRGGSIIVMLAGTYWFVQRVFLSGGAG